MAETSFPIQESPLGIDQWKSVMLANGRGIIDRGGSPYKLVSRDSVTDMVTIGVPSTSPQKSEALLDGFVHSMDTPKEIYLAPVSSSTTYEIGIVYDPAKLNDPAGPLTLTSWVAPGDTSEGKSRLVLFRVYREPNVALGSTSYNAEQPRVVPVISVSRESQLPVNSLILVDTIAVVRTTGNMFRADIDGSGVVSWSALSGNTADGSTSATANTTAKRLSDGSLRGYTPSGAQFHSDTLVNIGWVNTHIPDSDTAATPNTSIKRFANGAGGSVADPSADMSIANKRYVDNKKWSGSAIISSIPYENINGSEMAWNNTNLGSTWTTVACNSTGRFGRYPSALKYKTNVRRWDIDPATVFGVTPVKYEDKENGDTRVGFVADSYVNTLPEMVQVDPETGEVEGFNYFLWGVAQQAAIRDLNDRLKAVEAENETLKFNQNEIPAYLGLNTDDTGRVITDGTN